MHVRCFAHTLQLVIKDGFKHVGSISKVLGKASAIVSHVKKSIHATEALESEKSLQKATVTRWNSQLTMIHSILRIPKEKLDMLGTSHKLTQYDWKVLQDLDENLTPFETATQCIQGDKVVTSSMIVPCICVLKASMAKLSNKFSTRLVSALKTSVDDRLIHSMKNVKPFYLHQRLTLDLSSKWCSSSDEYSSIEAKFVAKVKSANAEDVVV